MFRSKLSGRYQSTTIFKPTLFSSYFQAYSSSKAKRTVYPYTANHSIALSLSLPKKTLPKVKHHQYVLVKCADAQIIEHAARRVDLFFYTLIAYYNSNVTLSLDKTILQHGRGQLFKKKIQVTQAAHSSIVTSVIENAATSPQPSRLLHTHFYENLNATVELPNVVNEFDHELEYFYELRCKALQILNASAQAGLHPILGLKEFLLILKSIFQQALTNASLDKAQIIRLQRQGSLEHTLTRNFEVSFPYIQMMLYLKPDEIEFCNENAAQAKEIYDEKILILQREILESKSSRPAVK